MSLMHPDQFELNVVRAELDGLRAQLAEAQAEIARLKGQASGLGMINIMNNETANRELAASQATNEKLRKGLQAAIAGLEFRKQHSMRHISDAVHEARMEDAIEKVKDILNLPNDTTALNKLLAGVYEECAKECDRLDYWYSARAIRALAKQKGVA